MTSQGEKDKAAPRLVDVMGVDHRDQGVRKKFVRFTEQDVRSLGELRP
ncbi:MAG: hypothetical protein HYY05_04560 [Chloroflexi bacterium]|nr:hypothetical protein [Chloroflexota bacterium]